MSEFESLYPFLYSDTSDLSAVLTQVRDSTVATSVVSEMAGSARLPTITGWTNSTATCCASVLDPPVPNTTSFPPRWNLTAIAWQAAATASAWPARWRVGALRSSNRRLVSAPSAAMTAP